MNLVQSVNLASAGNGISLAAQNAGFVQTPILVIKSLLAGPGITIVAGDSMVDVTISATGLPGLTSLVTASVHWLGSTAPASVPAFIAAYPVVVTAIIARIETPSSTPASVTLVKVPSGTVIASGTPLISAALDVTSTATVIQYLPLVTDITVVTLAAGDCVAVQTTGTWTGASGGLTIHMAPGEN